MRCKAIVLTADNVTREKESIQAAAREVQAASEGLNKRDQELENWAAELTRREMSIEKRAQGVSRLSSELHKREADVETLNHVLGSQQLALVKLDHDVIQRSAEYASNQREVLRRQAEKALAEINEDKDYFAGAVAPDRLGARVNAWIGKPSPEELDDVVAGGSHNFSSKESRAAATASKQVQRELSSIERELALAKRSLMSARGTMGRNEEFRSKTNELIMKESDFMAEASLRRNYL